MTETPTFGRYAEIPYDRMSPEQKEGFDAVMKSRGRLPGPAARRLGARPGQKNLLVRVVLRDLEKTLTNDAANALRDRIYLAIHQGTEHQWAVTSSP